MVFTKDPACSMWVFSLSLYIYIYYITKSLPVPFPERNSPLITFLPSKTIFGTAWYNQCNPSLSVHRCAHVHTQTHTLCPQLIPSLTSGHFMSLALGYLWLDAFPSWDFSAALHSSWTSKACMVTVKEKRTANTSKRKTKSFWFDLSDAKPLVWCINWYFIFITVQLGIQT